MRILNKIMVIGAAFTALNASAACVLDADIIKAQSLNEGAYKSTCLTDFISLNSDGVFIVMADGQEKLEIVDLSDIKVNKISLYVHESPNLKEIVLGDMKNFTKLSISDTALTDMRFLKDIETMSLSMDSPISHFPAKNSRFCQNLKTGKIKVDSGRNDYKFKENCGLELNIDEAMNKKNYE